jgi:thymidylate synthase (FAD)
MKAEYLDHMGSDLSIVNAARVSFDKVSLGELIEFDVFRDDPDTIKATIAEHLNAGWTLDMDLERWSLKISRPTFDDIKLISYLAKHDHWTPFAHTAISLRMQAPVPIRTQCFKHKQGLVENEESRRYISSRPVLFIPDAFRAAPTGGAKQGSSGGHPSSGIWLEHYKNKCEAMIDLYEEMIADGVAPEQARFVLPQGCEVQWIWTGNLYAFANFYCKRTDPHAQKEIRDLAEEVGTIIRPLFPVSWMALT